MWETMTYPHSTASHDHTMNEGMPLSCATRARLQVQNHLNPPAGVVSATPAAQPKDRDTVAASDSCHSLTCPLLLCQCTSPSPSVCPSPGDSASHQPHKPWMYSIVAMSMHKSKHYSNPHTKRSRYLQKAWRLLPPGKSQTTPAHPTHPARSHGINHQGTPTHQPHIASSAAHTNKHTQNARAPR